MSGDTELQALLDGLEAQPGQVIVWCLCYRVAAWMCKRLVFLATLA
jgi:hypothetical protein